MNTEFALLAQYEKPFVPLEDVCRDYFRNSPEITSAFPNNFTPFGLSLSKSGGSTLRQAQGERRSRANRDVIKGLTLNIGPQKARQMAARGELPIPVMRGSHSQKSPYLVRVSDLAIYLDEQYSSHRVDWEKARG